MNKIKAVIVDDEPLARQGLALRILEHPDFEIVAQYGDGQEALELVPALNADVLFVDIEMPRLNGIELAAALHKSLAKLPKIVFVTAFKDFALDAFEYQAFDYLLKPLSEERVMTSLSNLRHVFEEEKALDLHGKLNHLLNRNTGESLESFVQRLEQSRYTGIEELQQTISLKSGNDWVRVKVDNLLWIEAAGDYMCVHTQQGTHIIRKTLKQFEQELNADIFTRVNRSAIVNVTKISKLTPNSNGEYIATLSSGDELKVTRNYKMNINELS